jgi:hypothetical protein
MAQHLTLARIGRLVTPRGLAVVGVAAGLASIAGCKLDNAPGPTNRQAIVQFINAASRYPATDLYVDSTDALPNLPYGQGSSILVNAPTTPRQFTVRISSDTTTLASSQLLVENQGTYALILTQHSSGGGLIVLPDTVSAPPANSIGLRIVNAAPSGGAVDVYITGADSTLTTPIASSIPFEGVMQYQYVPAGPSLRLRVTAAGTKNVLLDVDASPLTPGQVRTIVVIDADAGGLPLTWLAIPDLG